MKSVSNYTATIYIGLKSNNFESCPERVQSICQDYCDRIGLCVTVTDTVFIYTSGGEPGCIIGLINYLRFPSHCATIRQHAIDLASILKKEMRQQRVSIVLPDEILMLEENE